MKIEAMFFGNDITDHLQWDCPGWMVRTDNEVVFVSLDIEECKKFMLLAGDELTPEQERELAFVLESEEDYPCEWYFHSDTGERHTTHTSHEFFNFAHRHRGWGYSNVRPKDQS